MGSLKSYRKRVIWLLLLATGIGLYFFFTCLPEPLFSVPQSTVLEDKDGVLLGAVVAADGQWRFPEQTEVSGKFEKAIIQFEDKRFYYHPGVDVMAMLRAVKQNTESKKVRSGGSTLTMQVIRLARKGKPRNVWQKLIESIMALRLEVSYSKKEILALYASYAPYGSNVVGLNTASWRYFGKSQQQLSWGETATLAVLPNSPSLIHPGRNRAALLKKRNRLLDKLVESGDIDSVTAILAKAEPLPDKPLPLPQLAPHLLGRVYAENSKRSSQRISVAQSTVDRHLQEQVNHIIARHLNMLRANGINNAAALVAEVETGNVLAYVGNTDNRSNPEYESDVDMIKANRSTGSILKPLLYAAMLHDGEILPDMLVADIPTEIAGYSPQNFNKEFDGSVPARRALERSLNIPAVRMLRTHGVEKFYYTLQKTGMTTLTRPPDNYGLSLILGGAEGSMWDVAGMYASMARTLNHFSRYKGKYATADYHSLNYRVQKSDSAKVKKESSSIFNAASIWCMFNAMEEVSRPDIDANWSQFSSSQRVAWKTGTSFGFRDAWAVGCTPKYVVVVWAGNADGEGRPGLTGVGAAAPIMFDIFKLLKTSEWFTQPYSEMSKVEICSRSGHRAVAICDEKEERWVPSSALITPPCPYHQLVHTDKSGKWRVDSECESPSAMLHKAWFVLPPAQEFYYKSKNHHYHTLPPYRSDCNAARKSSVMEFIYPKKSTQLYVPVELDGKTGKAVFEVAHRSSSAIIYWHLDDEYLGFTKDFHQMPLSPAPGKHTLALVDQQGERVEQYFEVLKREVE